MNQQIEWKTILSSNQCPSARWGHASFVFDSYFYVMGGYAGCLLIKKKFQPLDSKYMNDLFRFDFNTNQWLRCDILGPIPQARSNHTLIWHEEAKQAVLFGGGGVSKTRFNDVWTLDIQKMRWNQMTPLGDGPQSRTYHCATIVLNHLFIYGGENGQDLSDIHALDLQNKCWFNKQSCYKISRVPIQIIKTEDQPQTRRFAALNKVGDNQILLVGGCLPNYTPTPQIYLANITIAEKIQLKWIKVKHEISRWGHATIQKDRVVWLCGGRAQDEDVMEVVSLRSENNEIFLKEYKSVNQIQPRRKQCFSILGDSAVIFGGFNGGYLNDFHHFELPNCLIQEQSETRETILHKLFTQGQFQDFAFEIQNFEIKVHKFVLIAFLKHFQAQSNIIEQIFKLDRIKVDVDQKLFIKTLEIIYTQSQCFKNQQEKQQILHILKSVFTVNELIQNQAFEEIPKQSLLKLSKLIYFKLNKLTLPIDSLMFKNYDILISTQSGSLFKCHKAILSLQSGFFRGLLNHDFRDSEKETIQLNCISTEQFKLIYIFLYTSLWDSKQTDIYELFQLLRITQYLDIPTCANRIMHSIQMNLNETNIFIGLKLSSQFDDEIIQKICSEKQIELELNSTVLIDRTNYPESINEYIEIARKKKIIPFSQKNIRKSTSNKENQN